MEYGDGSEIQSPQGQQDGVVLKIYGDDSDVMRRLDNIERRGADISAKLKLPSQRNKIHIAVEVGTAHDVLRKLNEHMEAKRSHVRDLNRWFAANPIAIRTNIPTLKILKPRVDMSELHELNRLYKIKGDDHDSLGRKVKNPIKPKVDGGEIKQATDNLEKLTTAAEKSRIAIINAQRAVKDFSFSQKIDQKVTVDFAPLKSSFSSLEKTVKDSSSKKGILGEITTGLFATIGFGLGNQISNVIKRELGVNIKSPKIVDKVTSAAVAPVKFVLQNEDFKKSVAEAEKIIDERLGKAFNRVGSSFADALNFSKVYRQIAELERQILVLNERRQKASQTQFKFSLSKGIQVVDPNERLLQDLDQKLQTAKKSLKRVQESVSYFGNEPESKTFGNIFTEKLFQNIDLPTLGSDLQKEAQSVGKIIKLGILAGLDLQGLFDPIDQEIKKYRQNALKTLATPLVLERAAEIANARPNRNMASSVDKKTEELFIVTGGYAKAYGLSGARIAADLNKDFASQGKSGSKAIWIKNVETDIEKTSDLMESLQGITKSLAIPNLRGFGLDALEMASQAVAAIEKNPTIKIKFIGESGGGFVAEEAAQILKTMGLDKNVDYLSVGTPDFIGSPSDQVNKKIMSGDETLGRETQNLYQRIGIAKRTPRQDILGATEHPFEGYRGIAEIETYIKGLPSVPSKQEIDQIKAASQEFEKMNPSQLSRKQLDDVVKMLFSNLQLVKGMAMAAIGETKVELEQIANSFEKSYIRFAPESEDFSRARAAIQKANEVIKNFKKQSPLSILRTAEILSKEVSQFKMELKERYETKLEDQLAGTQKRKYDDIISQFEQIQSVLNQPFDFSRKLETQQEKKARAKESLNRRFDISDSPFSPSNESVERSRRKYLERMEREDTFRQSQLRKTVTPIGLKTENPLYQAQKTTVEAVSKTAQSLREIGRSAEKATQPVRDVVKGVYMVAKSFEDLALSALPFGKQLKSATQFLAPGIALSSGIGEGLPLIGGAIQALHAGSDVLAGGLSNMAGGAIETGVLAKLTPQLPEMATGFGSTVINAARETAYQAALFGAKQSAQAAGATATFLTEGLAKAGIPDLEVLGAGVIGGKLIQQAGKLAEPKDFEKRKPVYLQSVTSKSGKKIDVTKIVGEDLNRIKDALEAASKMEVMHTETLNDLNKVLSELQKRIVKSAEIKKREAEKRNQEKLEAAKIQSEKALQSKDNQDYVNATSKQLTNQQIAAKVLSIADPKRATEFLPKAIRDAQAFQQQQLQNLNNPSLSAEQKGIALAYSGVFTNAANNLEQSRKRAEFSLQSSIMPMDDSGRLARIVQLKKESQDLNKALGDLRRVAPSANMLKPFEIAAGNFFNKTTKEIEYLKSQITNPDIKSSAIQEAGYAKTSATAFGKNTTTEGKQALAQQSQDIGSDLTAGIAKGIQEAGKTANAAMLESSKETLDSAKDYWEIKSPSKKAEREIGLPIPQGIGKGIQKGKSFVVNAIKDLFDVDQGLDKQFDEERNQLLKSFGMSDENIAKIYEQPKIQAADLNEKPRLLDERKNIFEDIKIGVDGLKQRFPILQRTSTLFKEIGGSLLLGFGVFTIGDALVQLGRQGFQAALDLERTKIALDFTNAGKGAEVLDSIRQKSDQLGVSFTAAAESRKQLDNATFGTVLQGSSGALAQLQLEAIAPRELNADQQKRLGMSTAQVAAKGTFQREELLQFAEAGLPVQTALADALGISPQLLTKQLQQGSVSAQKALPLLFRQLASESAAKQDELSQSAPAQLNRLTNESQRSLLSAGQVGGAVALPVIQGLTTGLKALNDNLDKLGFVATTAGFALAGSVLKPVGDLSNALPLLISGLGALKNTALPVFTTLGKTLATLAVPTAGAAGLAALTLGIGAYYDRVIKGNDEVIAANRRLLVSVERIKKAYGELPTPGQAPQPSDPTTGDPLLDFRDQAGKVFDALAFGFTRGTAELFAQGGDVRKVIRKAKLEGVGQQNVVGRQAFETDTNNLDANVFAGRQAISTIQSRIGAQQFADDVNRRRNFQFEIDALTTQLEIAQRNNDLGEIKRLQKSIDEKTAESLKESVSSQTQAELRTIREQLTKSLDATEKDIAAKGLSGSDLITRQNQAENLRRQITLIDRDLEQISKRLSAIPDNLQIKVEVQQIGIDRLESQAQRAAEISDSRLAESELQGRRSAVADLGALDFVAQRRRLTETIQRNEIQLTEINKLRDQSKAIVARLRAIKRESLDKAISELEPGSNLETASSAALSKVTEAFNLDSDQIAAVEAQKQVSELGRAYTRLSGESAKTGIELDKLLRDRKVQVIEQQKLLNDIPNLQADRLLAGYKAQIEIAQQISQAREAANNALVSALQSRQGLQRSQLESNIAGIDQQAQLFSTLSQSFSPMTGATARLGEIGFEQQKLFERSEGLEIDKRNLQSIQAAQLQGLELKQQSTIEAQKQTAIDLAGQRVAALKAANEAQAALAKGRITGLSKAELQSLEEQLKTAQDAIRLIDERAASLKTINSLQAQGLNYERQSLANQQQQERLQQQNQQRELTYQQKILEARRAAAQFEFAIAATQSRAQIQQINSSVRQQRLQLELSRAERSGSSSAPQLRNDLLEEQQKSERQQLESELKQEGLKKDQSLQAAKAAQLSAQEAFNEAKKTGATKERLKFLKDNLDLANRALAAAQAEVNNQGKMNAGKREELRLRQQIAQEAQGNRVDITPFSNFTQSENAVKTAISPNTTFDSFGNQQIKFDRSLVERLISLSRTDKSPQTAREISKLGLDAGVIQQLSEMDQFKRSALLDRAQLQSNFDGTNIVQAINALRGDIRSMAQTPTNLYVSSPNPTADAASIYRDLARP